ncbi:MAG: hypothetical protein KDC53_21845, partial [Saprospiraceae bacterium]|nr:hypothetical protein [Saprospiraceae bacterium]
MEKSLLSMIERITKMRKATFILLLIVSSISLNGQSDCPFAEEPVTLNNPITVGNGTAGSCTTAALQTALN